MCITEHRVSEADDSRGPFEFQRVGEYVGIAEGAPRLTYKQVFVFGIKLAQT